MKYRPHDASLQQLYDLDFCKRGSVSMQTDHISRGRF